AVLPQALMIWPVLPDLMGFYREALQSAQAGGGASATDSAEMARLQAEMSRFQPLQIASSIISMAVVNSAIYRAVLEPENSAFGYLRLGVQELWVCLVTIVFYVLMVLGVIGAMIPVGVATMVAGQAGSWMGGLVVFLLACGGVAAIIWVWLRLSLAAPMSFRERKFRLFESWALTRGQGWRLFAVVLALLAIMVAGEILLVILASGLGAGAAMSHAGQIQAFLEHPPADWLARAAPWLAGIGVIYTVLMGVVFAIITAPFAEIYRQLTEPQDAKVF
ncbi:MAG TPA: hypothetical protein VFW47_15050, partial [Phenylobacterium sp.]|nr:hypothetical protein [Phenylobacterium sp.]